MAIISRRAYAAMYGPTVGDKVRLADFRGRRVLLTFERSVDW